MSDIVTLHPNNARQTKAYDRWVTAQKELDQAEHVRFDEIARLERIIQKLRENANIAYQALYISVPCVYCKAPIGKSCVAIAWPTMHTSRAADCFGPVK